MNGSVIPVSGMSFRLPAAMMNAWTPTTSARPAASSDRKSSPAEAAIRRPRSITTRYSPRIAITPISPSSSPSAASGKSVWISGIPPGWPPPIVGRPRPEPGPEQPAPAERVQRLDDLVAAGLRGRERVEPDVDPRLDVGHELVHDESADQEQQDPEHDVGDPARGRVRQQQEDGEEQQRRAEVALDHDDPEGDRPHRDHRREVRQRRDRERADPRRLLDEQRPVLGQIAGEEHHEDHLEQLRRLAADRARTRA